MKRRRDPPHACIDDPMHGHVASDFGRRGVDVARRLAAVVVLLRLPVRRLHGRRVLLHVPVAGVPPVRRLLVLPALAPQHVVEAGHEEDASDNAACTHTESADENGKR